MISEKLLKIIFLILLVVILGELTYYVYIKYGSREKYASQTNLPRVVDIPTIIPVSQFPETDTSKKDNETARLLLQSLKKSTELNQNKILIKSQRTNIYESNIKKIEMTSGSINTFKYDAIITLGYKPNEDYSIYLNKNDLDKMKVFTVDDDKLLSYNFSQLKKGDRVIIELITNMLEYFDKNTEQITIIKINK